MRNINLPNKIKQIFDDEKYVEFVIDNLKKVSEVAMDVDLADLLGVSSSSISTWKARSKVPYREIVLFCLAHEVPIETILFGEKGDFAALQDRSLYGGGVGEGDGPYMNENLVPVRRFDVELSAGGGALPAREDVLDRMVFKADWLRKIGVGNPDNAAILTVRGDSMAPTLEDRDPVIVDRGNQSLAEGVFALRMDDHLLIKRVQPQPDGSFVLRSDNSLYESVQVRLEDVAVIGRAIWTWRGRRL